MSDEKDPVLWQEVFNERALILTFFGALGGSVRAAVLKTSWREGVRVVFVGGSVAFGIGVLGPIVLKPWIGDVPDEMTGALGTLTAASFLVGLIAVTLVERFIEGRPLMDDRTVPAPREDRRESYPKSGQEEEAIPEQGELFDMNPSEGNPK